MAIKTEVTPQKEEVPEKEGPETPPDSPLLDVSDVAIKKLVRSAKRGYVTHDQINSLSKEVNSEQIEDILAMFSEMGVSRRKVDIGLADSQSHPEVDHGRDEHVADRPVFSKKRAVHRIRTICAPRRASS